MKVEFENKNRVDISMYQYDYGQQLEITGVDLPDAFELHVSVGTGRAEVVKGHFANGTGTVLLPDIALRQSVTSFDCWLFDKKEFQGTTLRTIRIHLNRREYPSDVPCIDDLPKVKEYADYVKENAELVSYAKNVGDELKKLAENGAFNGKDGATGPQGPKGDKGDAGTTDYNQLENRPLQEIEIAAGTLLADLPIGQWIVKEDTVVSDYEDAELVLHKGDIIKAASESGGTYTDNIIIVTDKDILKGNWADRIADMRLLSVGEINGITDDELNAESTHPVSNRAVTNAVNEGKTVIEYPDDYFILAEKNTEYRYLYPGANKIQIGMPTNSSSTVDFICSLVFRSPETATEFTYSNNLKFTGDECNDGVFVPAAKTVYNIIFWYDGYSYNAVVRGVDR